MPSCPMLAVTFVCGPPRKHNSPETAANPVRRPTAVAARDAWQTPVGGDGGGLAPRETVYGHLARRQEDIADQPGAPAGGTAACVRRVVSTLHCHTPRRPAVSCLLSCCGRRDAA